ncbi:MAG: phosphotransferase [Mycobacterium sp.]|nr:phosphotransferase [Mycobacterium sp.]
MGRQIERAAGRVSENAVAMANETLRDLCLTQPETMVHGDLHFNNILRGVREPWQVIDPKGCAGDPAYDVITLLRTTAMYLLGGEDLESALDRWIGIFADAAGLDRGHVQRWAQVRAVVVAQRSLENDRKPQWVRDINIRLVELLT